MGERCIGKQVASLLGHLHAVDLVVLDDVLRT